MRWHERFKNHVVKSREFFLVVMRIGAKVLKIPHLCLAFVITKNFAALITGLQHCPAYRLLSHLHSVKNVTQQIKSKAAYSLESKINRFLLNKVISSSNPLWIWLVIILSELRCKGKHSQKQFLHALFFLACIAGHKKK